MTEARSTVVALVLVASVVCGWWVTGLDPFSARATSAVLAAGVLAAAAGGARRVSAPARTTSLRAAAPWLVLVAVLMAWQLAAYVQHPRSDHPTMSSIINAALDPRPIRALGFAAWMLTAGWLARR